jgi:hypothetical protein
MTARAREVMFRIGGEEDLLDPPTAVPASVPPANRAPITSASMPPSAPAQPAWSPYADIPLVPEPDEVLIVGGAEVAAAPAPAIPAQPAEAAITSEGEAVDTSTAPTPDVPTPDPPAREDPARPIRAPTPPSHRRRRGTHHNREANRGCRSTATPNGRQRSGLAKLSSTVAWVNALILTMLVLAAVIGHTPASTTVANRELPSPLAQAPARAAAPLRITRLELAKILRRALARKYRVLPGRRARARRARVRAGLRPHSSTEFAP